jgi:ABC-type multidrug transport system ATPase subunit/pSer/pThr/pTyr-binding forkhead associated (FHA) protein
MGLLIEWSEGSKVLTEDQIWVIGRDSSVDVRIVSNKISRHHLQLMYESNKWVVKDLNSSNGTFKNGKPIQELVVSDQLSLNLGAPEGQEISLSVTTGLKRKVIKDVPAELYSKIDPNKRISLSARTRIGRDPNNNIPVGDLSVSRSHAEITQNQSGGFDLVDLDSSSGTFLNGQRIKRRTLQAGDVISVGSFSTRFNGSALEPIDASGGYSFIAENITVEIGEKKLLNNVSFELKPRSLTAVVGPSGAGKSTLLNALTGRRPASRGSVNFAGRDLYSQYDELRNRIGLVPQSDLLHTNLTTKKALEYGAALRFPVDTSPEERAKRVEEVLKLLELTERADLRIDKLSGGQRKRTSVALELLTEPALLFLDEPTSGLDPGLDRSVMKMLRNLADDGRTVVVVTHSVANLDVCDDVIIMAPGGHLAYFGSPQTVFTQFKANDWAGVFDELGEDKDKWATSTSTHIEKRIKQKNDYPELEPIRQQSWGFQLKTLSQRYVDVITADKAYLALIAILPVILAIVGYVSGNEDGLGPGLFGNLFARSMLLILILGATFMGAAASIQELVKERTIYERERSIGLSRSAYIFSKILVLGVIAIGQSLIFGFLSLAGRPQPAENLFFPNGIIEVVFIVALLTFISMIIGLLISGTINSTEVAMPSLVVITMAQVVLSGAVPLRYNSILDFVGIPNPSYWAMNAMGATTNLNIVGGIEPEDYFDRWESTTQNWSTNLFVLLVFIPIFIGVLSYILKSREPKNEIRY